VRAEELDVLDETWLAAKPGIKWRRYGPGVIAAWVADMDFAIPSVVRKALEEVLDVGDLGYPDWRGGSPLREAFAVRMATRYGWEPDPGRVRELTDVIQGLQVSLHLATAPGDAIAIHTPTYPPFLASIASMGRRLVPIPFEDTTGGWRFDASRAEAAIAGAGCTMLVLVNPHNPTGRVLEREELAQLWEIAERHDLLVVADEVHAELTYPPHSHVPFAALGQGAAKRTITLTSATKAFNLAGIRCALAHVGPQKVLSAWDEAPFALFGHASNLSVAATVAAWRDGDAWAKTVLSYLQGNRDAFHAGLSAHLPAIGHHRPEGTYLSWLDLGRLGLGPDPAGEVLERARVAVGRGSDFGPGGEGFIRVNFATSRALVEAIVSRLAGAFSKAQLS
jgi:cystathionine beta-lyase